MIDYDTPCIITGENLCLVRNKGRGEKGTKGTKPNAGARVPLHTHDVHTHTLI